MTVKIENQPLRTAVNCEAGEYHHFYGAHVLGTDYPPAAREHRWQYETVSPPFQELGYHCRESFPCPLHLEGLTLD